MNPPVRAAALMSGDEYRESLRRYRPTVFVDGRRVESVVTMQPSDRVSMPLR
jgi:4-hydroxybutyryl-CoA dehydratase / vinylacetyl-CoA-Delta-isomerase